MWYTSYAITLTHYITRKANAQTIPPLQMTSIHKRTTFHVSGHSQPYQPHPHTTTTARSPPPPPLPRLPHIPTTHHTRPAPSIVNNMCNATTTTYECRICRRTWTSQALITSLCRTGCGIPLRHRYAHEWIEECEYCVRAREQREWEEQERRRRVRNWVDEGRGMRKGRR